MRIRAFGLLLAACVATSICGQAWAGSDRALGSVVQANNALIDNATAMAGADVYACDVLDTDSYGNLRVQFQGSQIVLGPSSEVQLDGSPGAVRTVVASGRVGFSAPSPEALVLETPAGTLRGTAGQAFSGTIAITGPKELIVSAVRGDLVLNAAGVLHTVPEGKSAKISFDVPAVTGCRSSGAPLHGVNRPYGVNFKILAGIVGGGAGGYVIWHELTESESKPD